MCPVICFFAVETISSFWWGLEKFSQKFVPSYTFFRCGDYLSFWNLEKFWMGLWKNVQKSVPSHTFLRCGDYLKFLRGLGKFRQKDVPSYTFFSLWRLTWVFEGTWKNFHKKVCPVICFFAVETISSFWWGLEKFPQKFVPSYTFFRCGD